MKTRYLSLKNFDKLWARLQAKIRYGTGMSRQPYETYEEWQARLKQTGEERPISIVYHGRFHAVEFFSKK
jgi:hypothetical protein